MRKREIAFVFQPARNVEDGGHMLPKRFTDRLSLGLNGLEVSPICLGICNEPSMVVEAFEKGINFFFITADMHWPMYDGLREGIRLLMKSGCRRDDIVVAGVVYVAQPEFLIVPFEEIIENIPGLERIDVLVAGGCYGTDIEKGKRVDILAKRGRNRIDGARAGGASFHDRAAALHAINSDQTDIAFLRFNPTHYKNMFEVYPNVKKNKNTLIFNFKSTSGFIGEENLIRAGFELEEHSLLSMSEHYRFALSDESVDGLLCSPGNMDELIALGDAINMEPYAKEEMIQVISTGVAYREKEKIN